MQPGHTLCCRRSPLLPSPLAQLLPACAAGLRIARLEHWQRRQRQHAPRGRSAAAPGPAPVRAELAADEAYRVEVDGADPSQPPVSEPWFGAPVHCALADAAAALQLWFDGPGGGAAAAIVRPDRFVYGVYAAEELPPALDALAALLLRREEGGAAGAPPLLLPAGGGAEEEGGASPLAASEAGVRVRASELQRLGAVLRSAPLLVAAGLVLLACLVLLALQSRALQPAATGSHGGDILSK